MGCGESKHFVATQNTITKSKSRSIKKQDPKAAEIPKNGENVTANNALKDSVILMENEIIPPKKIESEVVKAEEEVKKEESKEVAAVVEIVHKNIKDEELKEEKIEEAKTDAEERESAAVVKAREEEKEIKNEELKEDKKDGVKADHDEVVSQQVGVGSEVENNIVREERKVAVAEEEGEEGKGLCKFGHSDITI